MASLEAKLLGERAENYCSSDEGEGEQDEEEKAAEIQEKSSNSNTNFPGPPPPEGEEGWKGYSQNTGPKGVLRDWELYKAHQEYARAQKEMELIKAVKESSITCRTADEDEKDEHLREQIEEELADNHDDLDELLNDKVLEEFIQKRMQTLAQQTQLANKPTWCEGLVDITSGDHFLQIVDETDKRVPVVIHIYDGKLPECATMNNCLSELTDVYRHVQFCKMRATVAGLSLSFKLKGIPALLVYKSGNLIGNFVGVKEDLGGTDFCSGDVENFLIENGMIEDRNNVPKLLVRSGK